MLGMAVLWTTAELRIVRNYLLAAWLADISHVGLTCWLLGYTRAVDVASWNAMTWGNVGFTVSCHSSYLSVYTLWHVSSSSALWQGSLTLDLTVFGHLRVGFDPDLMSCTANLVY